MSDKANETTEQTRLSYTQDAEGIPTIFAPFGSLDDSKHVEPPKEQDDQDITDLGERDAPPPEAKESPDPGTAQAPEIPIQPPAPPQPPEPKPPIVMTDRELKEQKESQEKALLKKLKELDTVYKKSGQDFTTTSFNKILMGLDRAKHNQDILMFVLHTIVCFIFGGVVVYAIISKHNIAALSGVAVSIINGLTFLITLVMSPGRFKSKLGTEEMIKNMDQQSPEVLAKLLKAVQDTNFYLSR